MTTLQTGIVCGKCLKPTPCPDAIARAERWENNPAIPESVKQFIRAYAVISKMA